MELGIGWTFFSKSSMMILGRRSLHSRAAQKVIPVVLSIYAMTLLLSGVQRPHVLSRSHISSFEFRVFLGGKLMLFAAVSFPGLFLASVYLGCLP